MQSDAIKGKEKKKNQLDANKCKEEKKPKGLLKTVKFLKFPYKEWNKLRHNLDLMHMEKNACDNFIAIVLDICQKIVDGTNA
jgi:hypothetical protein